MSMGIELFIAPAVIVAYLALERYIKFRAHIYDGMNEGPECDSVEAFDLSSGPKYTYDEEHSFTIRDALNKKEYALLNKIIVPMQKDSINNFGLSFLADVDEAILKDKKLLSLLRELTGTKADETVLLYIRSETEKRVYDDYDYDYVYRYYYVFLTPQNNFVEVFANSEYSPTFEGD